MARHLLRSERQRTRRRLSLQESTTTSCRRRIGWQAKPERQIGKSSADGLGAWSALSAACSGLATVLAASHHCRFAPSGRALAPERGDTASRRRPRRPCASAGPCRETVRGESMLCTTAVLSASKISNSPSLVFGAVDREIVEADSFDHGGQRALMAHAKCLIERAHEVFLFEALAFAKSHAGVEVPDVPAIGDRHMAGIGPAVDDDDAVFAKQAVLAGSNRQSARRRIPAPVAPVRYRPIAARSSILASPTPACEPSGRTMIGNRSSAATSASAAFDCGQLRQLRPRRRIPSPGYQALQFRQAGDAACRGRDCRRGAAD